MHLSELEIRSAEAADRLCFFAHYDEHDQVGDHVIHYLTSLRDAGFKILVASTSRLSIESIDRLKSHCDGLELRPNVGLDFGSWRHLYAKVSLDSTQELILTNDSVYGPTEPMAQVVARLCAVPADFYGLCGSIENGFHLQSWFMLFKRSAIENLSFRSFLNSSPRTQPKAELILDNEVRLTQMLVRDGLTCHSSYDPRTHGLISATVPFNPMHLIWRDLLASKSVPFIKIDLMRDNPVDISDIRTKGALDGLVPDTLKIAIEADLIRRRARISLTHSASPRSSTFLSFSADPVYLPKFRPFIIRDFRAFTKGQRKVAVLNMVAFLMLRLAYRVGRQVTRAGSFSRKKSRKTAAE